MTDSELAILSLLAESSNYDNTLNTLIETRGLRRWTAIGASSMYYVLEKLEKQGLIRKIEEDHGRRKFEITQAGIGILQTAIVDLIGTPHSRDKYFELGVANLHILKPSQVRSALLNRQQDVVSQIKRVEDVLVSESANTASFQVEAMFSHRLHLLKAELEWLNTFIEEWETQAEPDVEPNIEHQPISRSKQVVLPQDPDSIHKAVTRALSPDRVPTPFGTSTKTISHNELTAATNTESTPEKPEDNPPQA